MTGLPIQNWGQLTTGLTAINQTLLLIYELLKPDTGVIDDMEIPLKVKLLFGTGTNLGVDTPLPIFQEMNSEWQNILSTTIDSNQGVSGYKVAKLESFQPGKKYTFNISNNMATNAFDSTKPNPIEVFLIDSNIALSAAVSLVASASDIGVFNIGAYIPRFLAFLKRGGWVKNLPSTGGNFDITPGNFHCLIHFCVHTSNDGGQGAVITGLNPVTNTFTLGGY